MRYLTTRSVKGFVAGGFCFVLASPLQANQIIDSLFDDWYWQAFASQGLVYTSDNNFAGDSDDSISTEFRELGLIIGSRPFENVQVVGQILSRTMGEMDDGDLRLDYGFVNYMFLSEWEQTLGVKVGRIRSPLGFFNETRDVAHTRASIILPQSIYTDRLRNLSFSRDGIQLFGSYLYGNSLLSWDLVFAEVQITEEDLVEVVRGQDLQGEVDTPLLPMARLIWDWDAGRIRLGLTYHPLEYEYKAAPGDLYDSGVAEFDSWTFSAEYNTARWSLISEYTFAKNNLSVQLYDLPVSLSFDSRSHSYYAQGIYRFAPGWSGFLRYDGLRIQHDNPLLEGSRVKDLSVGLGWQPDQHWLLRAEWHLIDGATWLSVRDNPQPDLEKHWQMVLFQVSYRL